MVKVKNAQSVENIHGLIADVIIVVLMNKSIIKKPIFFIALLFYFINIFFLFYWLFMASFIIFFVSFIA